MLKSTIPPRAKTHFFNYTFEGFGPARTLVFKKAWEKFPEISHVLVTDPDWRPNLETIDKRDLMDPNYDSYEFKVCPAVGVSLGYFSKMPFLSQQPPRRRSLPPCPTHPTPRYGTDPA